MVDSRCPLIITLCGRRHRQTADCASPLKDMVCCLYPHRLDEGLLHLFLSLGLVSLRSIPRPTLLGTILLILRLQRCGEGLATARTDADQRSERCLFFLVLGTDCIFISACLTTEPLPAVPCYKRLPATVAHTIFVPITPFSFLLLTCKCFNPLCLICAFPGAEPVSIWMIGPSRLTTVFTEICPFSQIPSMPCRTSRCAVFAFWINGLKLSPTV